MNHDELPYIASLFGWDGMPEDTMLRLLDTYPGVNHLVVTRASDGAWWQTRDTLYSRTPPPLAAMVDTIGAGDSVTAAVMMGLLRGWEPERILDAAMNIASFVCSCRGGTPELSEALKNPFLG